MTDSEAESSTPRAMLTARARRRLFAIGAMLSLLVGAPYVVPGFEELRASTPDEEYVPFWNVLGRSAADEQQREEDAQRVADFESLARETEGDSEDEGGEVETEEPVPVPVLEAKELARAPAADSPRPEVFPPYAGHADDVAKVVQEIEFPQHLSKFFTKLTFTDMKLPGAITRAGHWGDSVLGGDGLTYVLRKRMQERFGDAGHGFHALSKYSVGYRHRGVRFSDANWRSCEIIFKCRPDGHYGYAGVSTGSPGGGVSRYRTSKKPPGNRVSRFELWYQRKPDGGKFQIDVDGARVATLETEAESLSDHVFSIDVPDEPHAFRVRAGGGGEARGYGVVLERDGPGVVWDELSLIGSFTQRLDYQDPIHLAGQLQRREVDLMVFMFGGNDVQREFEDLKRRMTPYENEYMRVIQKFQDGRPQASCMVMSLIDHGKKQGSRIVTRGIVPRLVKSQRKVAEKMGCSFFDTFTAMGGNGSIGRWFRARPQLGAGDFSHPTAAGQRVIANLVYRALMREYASFRKRVAGTAVPTRLDL